jgi:hypothetical protein
LADDTGPLCTGITFDFLKSGVAFTALVIVLAWAMPDLTQDLTVERLLRPFEGPWQEVEDTWNRMYKSFNLRAISSSISTFGKSMAWWPSKPCTDRPIFDAETPERSYWRAAAYDEYTGQGWLIHRRM